MQEKSIFGYCIAGEWVAKHFFGFWQKHALAIQSALQTQHSQNPPPVDPLFKQTVIAQLVSADMARAIEVAQDGLTELICDAIGVHLLGPAALAASSEFCARVSLDQNPLEAGHYPPWRYRLRLMLKACEDDVRDHVTKGKASGGTVYPSDTIRPFVAWLGEVKQLVSATPDLAVLKTRIVTDEVYKAIESDWDQIRQSAIALLPARSRKAYALHKRVSQIGDLVERLKESLPPNEWGTWPDTAPATLEDVLNAAWVYKLLMIHDDSSWGSADQFERLFRLVLKGIESSYVQNTFGTKLKSIGKP